MAETVKIKKLEWLSDFFGVNCGEVITPSKSMKVSKQDLDYYHFLQGKCFKSDSDSKNWFEENGFFFEDSRVTFQKSIEANFKLNPNINIKKATIEDSSEIQNIATSVMAEHSRFVNLVGERKTQEFYATWVKNAIVSDFDHVCFFATINGQATGFITLRFVGNTKAIIGLIGVKKEFWGKGIAKNLIYHAETHLFQNGFKEVEVATEGRNHRALNFYKRFGFDLIGTEFWYYKILKKAKMHDDKL